MNNQNLKHEIFSAISSCGYPPNVTDQLIGLISQVMSYPYVKSPSEYKIKTINQEKMIAVRCPMEIPYNKKNYEVPIVIFFSKFIPIQPPRIYLEVAKGSAINPKIKDVDIQTRKIMVPSLLSWNSSSNIIVILNEIKASFSKIFPIYKIKKNSLNEADYSRPTLNITNNNINESIQTANTININNNAVFNFVSHNNMNDMSSTVNNTSPNNDPFANIASIFTENFISNNNNNAGFNFAFNNSSGFQTINNTNQNININSNNNMNNNFNPNIFYQNGKAIKNILVDAVLDKISSKLIVEYKKLNQQNKTLNNYKNQYKYTNDKMEKYISKKQEITSECTKNLFHLNNDIKKYNEYIQKKKDDKITDQNCLEYIKVESPQVIRAIANEINYEELIILIKKGFEKKKITFEEAILSTRNAARDLFVSKIIRQKGLKMIGKFY